MRLDVNICVWLSVTQRSIQDELNRESRGDVLTILISYLVMFAYVSVMLGHYRSIASILVSLLICVCPTCACLCDVTC